MVAGPCGLVVWGSGRPCSGVRPGVVAHGWNIDDVARVVSGAASTAVLVLWGGCGVERGCWWVVRVLARCWVLREPAPSGAGVVSGAGWSSGRTVLIVLGGGWG